MANTKSAKRAVRVIARRTEVNRTRRNRMRTFVKKVEAAILAGDYAQARESLRLAQPEMHRAVAKGIAHKNTVSRKLSRLSARIKQMGKAA